MEKKTAKALYELLKELYQSRAAKEFVDAYEHEQRHEKQERETPKNGEIYRDIFGNKYVIVGEEFLDGKQTCIAMLSFDCKDIPTVTNFFTVPLEDFMNPTFKKE